MVTYSPLSRSLQTPFLLLLVLCFFLSSLTLLTFLAVSPLFKSCSKQETSHPHFNPFLGRLRKDQQRRQKLLNVQMVNAGGLLVQPDELLFVDGFTTVNGHLVVPTNGGLDSEDIGLADNVDRPAALATVVGSRRIAGQMSTTRQFQPGRPLRIAQIAPLYESVPPKLYGGTERVVHFLTEELVRRGHQVTLFASADSNTSARLIANPAWPALRLNPPPTPVVPYAWMLEQVRLNADEFDILHFHTMEHFNIAHSFLNRSVTTLHGLLSFSDLVPLFQCFDRIPLISISDDQRLHLNTTPNFVATVYHGIPKNLFPFTDKPQQREQPYLAFLGRISPEKRPEWAIQIAVRAGIPLKIAAKVDVVDKLYWETVVKPLADNHTDIVEYIGEINEYEKADFLGNALALLFPVDWFEPFGLVMIEAMACGTPVVARRTGSTPEVIDDGLSGILFNTLEEGVEAVKRVDQLDRPTVRDAFERRWSSEKMAEHYLTVYERMLKN